MTGLGRGVVSQRVDQAIKMGLLADGEFGASSGGRQPRKLRFCGEQGLIVIYALGALHVRVGIAGLDGDILEHMHRNWDISRGHEETIDLVISMVDELLEKGNKQPVWSVVVGLPGPVDFFTGRPVAPAIMPGWKDFDVCTPFEERYDEPVWVDNDVNLLALGERARRRDVPTDLIYFQNRIGYGCRTIVRGTNTSWGKRCCRGHRACQSCRL